MMNENTNNGRPDPAWPAEVQAWMDRHPGADKAALEKIWHMAGYALLNDPSQELDPARVALIRSRIQTAALTDAGREGTAAEQLKSRPHIFRLTPVWAVAASFVLLLGAGLFLGLRTRSITVPARETMLVTLPDGSLIEMNSGTSLSYRRAFGWLSRRVQLDGEAYFDVQKNGLPFHVHTFNASVEVLGTRFNVRAWGNGEAPETVVVLEDGQVRFSSHTAPEDAIVLHPRQMSLVGRDGIPSTPEKVLFEPFVAWRSGGYAFDNAPTGVILEEIERRFGVVIHTQPETIRTERLSLFLGKTDNIETILEVICSPRNYRYRTLANGYVIENPHP